jgi:hypothetical protein
MAGISREGKHLVSLKPIMLNNRSQYSHVGFYIFII